MRKVYYTSLIYKAPHVHRKQHRSTSLNVLRQDIVHIIKIRVMYTYSRISMYEQYKFDFVKDEIRKRENVGGMRGSATNSII